MKIAVTGATGYIGSRLVRHALSSGNPVIALSRRTPRTQVDWMPFDFSSGLKTTLPSDTDAMFHLAAITTSEALAANAEIRAAKQLIAASLSVGAKFIFVSSQTAREDSPTAYGQVKWEIERLVISAGGVVVRPGLVYGGQEDALFGRLVRAVRNLPVLPAFVPAPMVQPLHVDDLVVALLRCSRLPARSIVQVGATVPVSFTDFLRCISRSRLRRFRLPVPIPGALLRLSAWALGQGIRHKTGLDRLVALYELPVMDTAPDMAILDMALRPLEAGMAPSGNNRRRMLIREAGLFLSYVLKTRASIGLVRRYVRCIELLDDGQALLLPPVAAFSPLAVALLDDADVLSTQAGRNFSWRLNAAVALAEADVQGARRFQSVHEPGGIICAVLAMSLALASEGFWRAVRWIAWPLLKPSLRRAGLTP